MAPPGQHFRPQRGGCPGFPKRRIFKKLVAVDGGGQLLAVVHGQRLGCFAVEGVGKAGTALARLSPPLWWGQRACPCLERATGRSGCLALLEGGAGGGFARRFRVAPCPEGGTYANFVCVRLEASHVFASENGLFVAAIYGSNRMALVIHMATPRS